MLLKHSEEVENLALGGSWREHALQPAILRICVTSVQILSPAVRGNWGNGMTSNLRYVEIAEKLREQMERVGPNTVMPTEHQLSKRFNVSRVTIRHSLDLLERSGIITRQRGRGTVANPEKVVRNNLSLIWFEDDLRTQGVEFETRVLKYERLSDVPNWIRDRLKLNANRRVGFFSIVRLVHDAIVCHETRYSTAKIFDQLDHEDILEKPFYQLVFNITGKQIEYVDMETEILPAPMSVATALRVKPGSLILTNTSTHFLSNGVPIEATAISYRLDRCKFKAQGHIYYPNVPRGEVKESEMGADELAPVF